MYLVNINWIHTQRTRITFLVGCFCLVMVCVTQVQASPLDIQAIWSQVLAKNPQLKQSELQSEISGLAVKTSRKLYWPNASANLSSGWSKGSQTLSNSADISVSQTLWDRSSHYKVEQAQENLNLSHLEEKKAALDLAFQVGEAYLDLASAYDALALAQQKYADDEALLKITHQNYLAGNLKRVDLEDARSNNLDTQVSLLSAEADVQQRLLVLEQLMGSTVQEVKRIRDDVENEPSGMSLSEDEWLAQVEKNNLQLLINKLQLKTAQLSRQESKATTWPTVSGSVSYGKSGFKEEGFYSASIGVSIPIDISGKQRLDLIDKNFQILNSELEVEKQNQQLTKDVKVLLSQFRLQWQRIELAKKQVQARRESLILKKALYDAGQSDITDVIDAQNSLFSMKSEVKSRLSEYWKLRMNLMKIAGYSANQMIDDLAQALED